MKIETESLLLSDQLAPITTSMGFFEADCHHAAQQFEAWQNEIGSKLLVRASSRRISGSLESVLRSLLPLRMVDINRSVFIPTATSWTAYFDNGYRGSDPTAIRYLAERLKCQSVWIVARPHTLQKTGVPRPGRHGALLLGLYGPKPTDHLNLIREIRLQNDAGSWEFSQSGQPLPFEDTNRYGVKTVKDRLPFDLFERYLAELGITPFDESFYLAAEGDAAVLVEKSGSLPKTAKNISLKRARRLNGIDDGLRIRGRLISRNGYF